MYMSEKEWSALLERITKQSADYLQLFSQKLNSEDIKALVQALNQNPLITKLDLSFNDEIITLKGCQALAGLKYVKTLKLRRNSLSPETMQPFEFNSTIEELDVSDNKIGDQGLKSLSTLSKLHSLDVEANRATEVGLSYFTMHKTLRVFDFSRNQIGPNGIMILVQMQLFELRLACNEIGDTEAEILGKNNVSIKKLILSRGNNITDVGASFLAENLVFEEINLNGNQIGDRGAIDFGRNLKLRSLSLDDNQIGDPGLKALAASGLKRLSIYGNPYTDKGLSAFLDNRNLIQFFYSTLHQISDDVWSSVDAQIKLNRSHSNFLPSFKKLCSEQPLPIIETPNILGFKHEDLCTYFSNLSTEKKELSEEEILEKIKRAKEATDGGTACITIDDNVFSRVSPDSELFDEFFPLLSKIDSAKDLRFK
jgi:Leucine-rich repeat (LRR) protein